MQVITQKVQEIVEIINGKLINAPAIGGFCGYCTRLEDIKRGSLFFATNPSDIDAALVRGAFGIVFDKFLQTQIHDEEIAWIRVESMQDAIIRLTRYELLARGIKMLALNPTQYLIAKSLIRAKSVLFFDDSPMELLDALEETHPEVIITKSPQVLELALESTPCTTPEILPFTLAESSMFEIKFYYKLHAFHIPLPSVFVPELAAVVELCICEGIVCDFSHFEPIPALMPISLTQDARILSFGSSARVIIPTNDTEIFLRYANFLHDEVKWAKIVVFMPRLLDEQPQQMISQALENNALEPLYYDSSNELPALLKKTDYNFGLVFGISTQGLVFVLSQMPQEHVPTLF